jgi:colanic acid/amylovoran biosynthesis glycosyltransferase
VLARETANLSEFPLDTAIYALAPTSSWRHRSRLAKRLSSRWSTVYNKRVAEQARHHACVAIHAHFGWSGNAALQALRELGTPLVTAFYGRDLIAQKRRFAREDIYGALFDEGTLFFCEGPALAGTLRNLGCPAGKIRLVRIGIDLDQFPFVQRTRTKPLVIVQAARLVEKKGADLSIRAFAGAQEQLGPSELWIVGDGPERSALEALAAELGINNSVRFIGDVSHQNYREVLGRAHLCLQPSRTAADGDTEGGAPTVLIEMQASGLPVVATRHADIPYIVPRDDQLADEEDVSGLADALVRVARLPDNEWRARAEEARTFIEENHDARLIARQIEGFYSEARDLNEGR